MLKHTSVFVALLGLAGATAACGQSGNPARPSAASAAISSQPASPVAQVSTGHPSPAELIARGWTCFTPPPFPTRTVCSRPNQGFPVVATPPPADRPATFTIWVYENGQFVGTELLLRPDLYCGADVSDPAGTCTRQAPLCESTGQTYFYAALIGYYECIHKPGE
jgi:hypothetical protein